MNIALFAHSGIFLPLQGLLRRMGTARQPAPQTHLQTLSVRQSVAPKSIATCAIPARAGGLVHAHRKPLRVVQVMEAGQARASVGRMVISGRMADVCAELDRLVACEAARLQ